MKMYKAPSKDVNGPLRTSNWGGPIRQIILLALVLPLFGTTRTVERPLNAQPHQLVLQNPAAHVDVIVQKSVSDNRVEDQVLNIGGEISKNLDIINAFV